MSAADAYRPRCLKQAAWPRACVHAWEDAQRPAELFDAPKPAAQWRPATITKIRKGFGVYLHWLTYRGLLLDDSQPDNLVTLARMRDYQEALIEAGCAPLTIYNRIQELHLIMGVLAPQRDWSWLGKAAKRIRHSARTIRHKLQRLQPVERLERLGVDLMCSSQHLI